MVKAYTSGDKRTKDCNPTESDSTVHDFTVCIVPGVVAVIVRCTVGTSRVVNAVVSATTIVVGTVGVGCVGGVGGVGTVIGIPIVGLVTTAISTTISIAARA